MSNLVFFSALLGALISGMLSFVVRRVLDARAQREAERKLAYVVLVRVNGLLSAEEVIRKFLGAYLNALPTSAGLSTAEYSTSHRISNVVAWMLDTNSSQFVDDPKNKTLPRLVKRMLEDAKESRLSPEQLAKLPRDVIYAFDRYQAEHSQLIQVAGMWSDLFEHGEKSWVTPEGLHDQWRSLNRFLAEASRLRVALIRFGAATAAEADALSSDQRTKLLAALSEKFSDKPKLEAAGKDKPAPQA